MRIAGIAAAAVLLAGCSPAPENASVGGTALTPITPSRPDSSRATSPPASSPETSTGAAATAAPGPGATAAEAIAWVQAAEPVDAAEYNIALRGGVTTSLGEDVAFTTPAGISCMTDDRGGPADLACLVDLDDPPPQPPGVYGVWKGGWVDFDGTGVKVGSAHGDPGRFAAGQGPPLPPERSLAFGDFRCRTDPVVLMCVNYARRTAVRYADSGVDAPGCIRTTSPEPGIGVQFTC
jgi:hypothetical protein